MKKITIFTLKLVVIKPFLDPLLLIQCTNSAISPLDIQRNSINKIFNENKII